jgi:hypothetical protein
MKMEKMKMMKEMLAPKDKVKAKLKEKIKAKIKSKMSKEEC